MFYNILPHPTHPWTTYDAFILIMNPCTYWPPARGPKLMTYHSQLIRPTDYQRVSVNDFPSFILFLGVGRENSAGCCIVEIHVTRSSTYVSFLRTLTTESKASLIDTTGED